MVTTNSFDDESTTRERAAKLFLEHYHFVQFVAFEEAPHIGFQGDIVNDAFVDFMNKAEQWDLDSDVRPLLKRITQIIAMRYWKSHLQTMPESLRLIAERVHQRLPSRTSLLGTDRLDEELTALSHCIEKLPLRSRELLEIFYYKQVSLADYARTSNQNAGTIRKNLTRIRLSLKKCISSLIQKKDTDD